MGLKSSIEVFLKDKKWRGAKLLALFAVLAFACVECEDSPYAHWVYDDKIQELENEIQYYKEKIEADKKSLEDLHTRREHIERLAREQFFMKKENEDVYIIVE